MRRDDDLSFAVRLRLAELPAHEVEGRLPVRVRQATSPSFAPEPFRAQAQLSPCPASSVRADCRPFAGGKHPVDHTAVEVDMRESRPKNTTGAEVARRPWLLWIILATTLQPQLPLQR